MSAKKIDKINSMISELEKALKFENYEERIEVKASFIHMDILQKVIELMKNSKDVSNKTELAKRLGKSKGFVSQLFSGDKILNLKMIAQLEEIFNSKFIPSFKDYSEYTSTTKFGIDDYTNYSDYELNKPIIYNLKDYPPVKAA